MTVVRGILVTCVVAGALAVVGALAVADTGMIGKRDASTCPDQKGCAWNNAHYTGDRREIDADLAGTGWHNFDHGKQSAKNRFNAKSLVVAKGSDGNGDHNCMRPGDELHDFFFTNPDGTTAQSFTVRNDTCTGWPY